MFTRGKTGRFGNKLQACIRIESALNTLYIDISYSNSTRKSFPIAGDLEDPRTFDLILYDYISPSKFPYRTLELLLHTRNVP